VGDVGSVEAERRLSKSNPESTNSSLSSSDLDSIVAAVAEETAASKDGVNSSWLEIDAVETLGGSTGSFVYRLALSSPARLQPEQSLVFQTFKPKDEIKAVVLASDDDGLVVECHKPLPTDARLLSAAFDPGFILHAGVEFVRAIASKGGAPAALVAGRAVPRPTASRPRPYPGLNSEQATAVNDMASTPLYFLWGPPGTGKTTTIGAAVARWLREGKRVLVVSTSNAAVDIALRSVLKQLKPAEKRRVLRFGTSLDPLIREITPGGKWGAEHFEASLRVVEAQERLKAIRERLQNRGLAPETMQDLFAQMRRHEIVLEEFHQEASLAAPRLEADAFVTGCTLARMVLDTRFRERSFDVVVLDEASMASVVYAFAASLLASCHVVYAGDPMQLPPIVQSDAPNARRWFGQSIYDWFEVRGGERPAHLRLLREQYRMTDQIGGLVSRLSYDGALIHGRRAQGPKAVFIDVPSEWQTVSYSVPEGSYFNLASIPLLHALAPRFLHEQILLLSPFRPQRSLLAALAFDLQRRGAKRQFSASTIHKAQGSEAQTVVVDLTAHAPHRPPAFFRDRHCERLFNVAASRAKDQLFVIGSAEMLRELAQTMPFWGRLLEEFGRGVESNSCNAIFAGVEQWDSLSNLLVEGVKNLPAIYSHQPWIGDVSAGVQRLNAVEASRKLLVSAAEVSEVSGDFIARTSASSPPVFLAGGKVCVPYQGKWFAVDSPNASRVIWRVGLSHLADDEVDAGSARRFFCPDCFDGDLVLQSMKNEGWFLVCTNSRRRTCNHRRRLSLADAKLKIRLQNMRCPDGHPMTARLSGTRYFIGCENYPVCDHSVPLSILEGM